MNAGAPDTPVDRAPPAAAPLPGRLESWRLVLAQRALPLPMLRPTTIGADARNSIQLAHGSVRPSHARLERRGRALEIRALAGDAQLLVDGRAVKQALLQGGETVHIGELAVRIERGDVTPAVQARPAVALSLEEEFYALFRRELRRMPWLAISITVHVALFLWADQFIWSRVEAERARILLAAVDEMEGAIPESAPVELPNLAPEPPEFELDLPDIEPVEVEEEADLHYLEDLPIGSVKIGDLRGIGLGEGGGGLGGFGGRGIRLEGVQGPLRQQLRAYRERGLDVVFLVDTTASMESFLRAAKLAVDRMISQLADLVPNIRLGIVAYRDKGDDYVVKLTPLSADRYAILNFLESLEAKGGGDVPEAILEAVSTTFDQMQWRQAAHRVLVIVADAPPHPEEMARIRMRLRSETRAARESTVVSTIFTGRGQLLPARQIEAERALAEIAELGGGEFSHLDNPRQVVSQLIGVTLGTRFRAAAEELLEQRAAAPRQAMINAKLEERDLDWLFRKLRIPPVEPGVVEGLIQIGSPAVAMRCLALVADAEDARGTREAALYVLRRITRYGGTIDLGRSLAAQQDEMRSLKAALESTYRRRG